MKNVLFLFLLTVACKSSQKLKNTSLNNIDWNKSIVDIRSESDKYDYFEIQKFIADKAKILKTYTQEQQDKDYDSLRSFTNTITGTAIYLSEGANRYLITAKHVVYDKNFTLRHRYLTRENLAIRSFEYFEKFNAEVTIETPLSLFKRGMYNDSKIPNIDQDSTFRPFKFSTDNLDIAILSLQSVQTYPIRKLLEDDGYIPLDINFIDTLSENKVGDDITAIGYPSYSALFTIRQNNQINDKKVVLPITTFGRVALTDTILNYFIADITINPGNSGGPIIKNGKIVGIVSQQMLVNLHTDVNELQEQVSKTYSRSALAYIIKAKHIIQILNKLKTIEGSKEFKLQKDIPQTR